MYIDKELVIVIDSGCKSETAGKHHISKREGPGPNIRIPVL